MSEQHYLKSRRMQAAINQQIEIEKRVMHGVKDSRKDTPEFFPPCFEGRYTDNQCDVFKLTLRIEIGSSKVIEQHWDFEKTVQAGPRENALIFAWDFFDCLTQPNYDKIKL